MVTTQGFNALLKLVEEPPDFLVFVFATTEPDKVLTTIRSRTHHYPFRLIPPGVMQAHLDTICALEQISVEPAVLPLVVRAGGGSARDALSILDQLLSGAGPGGVTYARAVALLGVSDAALLDDMVDSLAAGDAAAVYRTIDRVVEAGHDPRRFAIDLLDRFRDLILIDAVPDALTLGLVDAPQDALAGMADQAMRLGGATLTRYAEIVHTALIEMRGTTSPRLVLELLCARMQLPDAAADSAAMLQRIERLERRHAAVADTDAAPPPAPQVQTLPPAPRAPAAAAPPAPAAVPSAEPVAAAPAPPPAPPPAASSDALDAPALRRLWPDALDVVKQSSRRTRALLDNAQITSVVGDLITLAAPSALAKMIAEDSNTSVLREALNKVVGGSWRVTVDPAGAGAASPARPAQPAAAVPAPPVATEEPDPRDDTDEAAQPVAAVDPEAEALRLLSDQLGARPVEG
jgi:DNA polymerase-3 subunit gamma/tau